MKPICGLTFVSMLAICASAQTPDARQVLTRSDDSLLHAATVRLKSAVDLQMSVSGVEVKVSMSLDAAMATGKRFNYQVAIGENEKLTVSDGKTTWIYTPKSKSYMVTPGSSGGPAQDMQNILYGKADANITRAETLRVESISIGTSTVECYVIRGEYPRMAMFPNSGAAVRTVWIGRESGLIWRDIWEGEAKVGNPPVPSHARMTYNYSVLEYGVPLADDLFTFRPPEGATLARTFTPPTAIVPSNPSILAPPDANLPNINKPNFGDPLGELKTASNGTSSDGGIGAGVYRAGNGVSKPELIHKVQPEYSEEARKAKYQGVVVLYIVVDQNGNAVGTRVMKGLGLGLDEKAIEAVRQWKFKPGFKDGKPVAVAATVEVNFRLLNDWLVTRTGITAGENGLKAMLESMPTDRSCKAAGTVNLSLKVNPRGEVTEARALSATNAGASEAAVSFAKGLRFKPPSPDGNAVESEGEISLTCPGSPTVVPKQIAAIAESPTPPPSADGVNKTAGQIVISGAKQAAKLLQHPEPTYPDVARQARISGTVKLRAVIATDGTVKELSVIEGHPLLRAAAMDAVKNWTYEPTLLNGRAVEVMTEVDVIFSLDN